MVLAIIILTSLVSIYAFYQPALFGRLQFNAYSIKHNREAWRFFSYGLLHAGWAHLFINMFVLYSFGNTVLDALNYYFGPKAYLFFSLLYVGGIIFSVLVDFGRHKDDPGYNAVGASGAVSSVVFSSILLYPSGKIYLFPVPFPIPSIVFGMLYLVYSAVMARRGKGNVGHSAHFWGAVYGIVFTIALKPQIVLHFWQQIQRVFR